jgi:hypothetical protein
MGREKAHVQTKGSAMNESEKHVIRTLIDLARAVEYAADDGEEMSGGAVLIPGDSWGQVCSALDELDALPDDQPNYTMSAAAKAAWALRQKQ